MKKLYLILCAGILALAAVSCNKDVKPAKPMSATEIKQKLANTAVDAINEVDPDNWTPWVKTGREVISAFKEVEPGNIDAFRKDLNTAIQSIVEKDGKTFTTTLLQLSLIKGDITVENNAFKYTKSNNLLNITFPYGGKTYKVQVESVGESSDGIIIISREYEDEVYIAKAVVPTTAALHVTENGKLFLDVVVNPVVEDKNKNGVLDDADAIKGSATIQIPDYSLALNDMYISDLEVKAAVTLSHANKSVLGIFGQADMDLLVERVKAIESYSINYIPKALTGNVSILGGTALVKSNVNVEKLPKSLNATYETEDEAKSAAATIAQNLKADLYFDNNPTIQASLCVMVQKNVSTGWDVVAGVHLYDGSADVPASEFFDLRDEVWKPVVGKATSFVTKIKEYFGGEQPAAQ